MGYHARLCGWTLARAHARSGDSIAIAEYLGEADAFDLFPAPADRPVPGPGPGTEPEVTRSE